MGKLLMLLALINFKRAGSISVWQNESTDLEPSTGVQVSHFVPFQPARANNIRRIPYGVGNPYHDIPVPSVGVLPPVQKISVDALVDSHYDPLLGAVLLATSLRIPDKPIGYNHPELLPPNPYVALLLSHYGRYIAIPGVGHGLYGYGAVNNYHNNKPFGAYKIYEDNDS